jgi:hypothetical protein
MQELWEMSLAALKGRPRWTFGHENDFGLLNKPSSGRTLSVQQLQTFGRSVIDDLWRIHVAHDYAPADRSAGHA